MSITMGRCIGALVVLYTVAACDSSGAHPANPGITDPEITGTGGTNPQGQGGTNPQGQGGTDPQGQGGTNPQGQGGTDPQGQGGTDPQGQGGTDPQGQGGTAGEAGGAGAAGSSGAAGATSACDDKCDEPCYEGYVITECEDRCVCEFVYDSWKELLTCDLDEPCPPSTQYRDPGTFKWEGGACLLKALRDRTPGKYRFSDTFADAGSQTNDDTFFLDGSDKVLVLDIHTSGLVVGNLTRSPLVVSCTLKSYDELDDCVAAGTAGSPAGGDAVCDSTTDWFQDCEQVENPECPAE